MLFIELSLGESVILTPLRDRTGWGIIESHITQSRVAIMGWDWPSYIVSKQALTMDLEYRDMCVMPVTRIDNTVSDSDSPLVLLLNIS